MAGDLPPKSRRLAPAGTKAWLPLSPAMPAVPFGAVLGDAAPAGLDHALLLLSDAGQGESFGFKVGHIEDSH